MELKAIQILYDPEQKICVWDTTGRYNSITEESF